MGETPRHRVKIAAETGSKRNPRFTVECVCGWSSPTCFSPGRANELYLAHKTGRTATEREAERRHRELDERYGSEAPF